MYKKFLVIFILTFIVNLMNYTCTTAYRIYEKYDENFTVCIDPGHQGKGDPKGEPIAPGSNNKKARVSSGTVGVATKNSEHVVNLKAAMILKELLSQKKYNVIMTRETDNVNISNIE